MTTPLRMTAWGGAWTRATALRPLRLLLSPRLWKSLVFLLLDLPAGLLYFLVLFTLLSVGVGTLPLGVGFVLLALAPPLTRLGARIERQRARWLLDEVIPTPARPQTLTSDQTFGQLPAANRRSAMLRWARSFFQRSWRQAQERETWRNLAYLLALYPIGTLVAFAIKAQVDVFTVRLVQPAIAAAQGAPGVEASPWALLGLPGRGWIVALVSVLVGMIWLLAGVYLIVAAASMHRAFVRSLLGPAPLSERARLEARVRAIDQSRTRLLDAVLLERQRLERDLHDGAQQHLVALALNLGMAREKIATQPDVAEELIARAHEESKRALAELRDLVRGIHPAVLTDRGLDAALSALAARCPTPVSVDVRLPERPSDAVEATAYFAAAEALANIAKHSCATAAQIEACVQERQDGRMFSMCIRDDGRGGANETHGTGLMGIADRVAALDGRLIVTSPMGGPTQLMVELPWRP